MSARPKREVSNKLSSSPQGSYREDYEDEDSIGLDEELEDDALSGEGNLISDDEDEPMDDGELEADDVYDDGEAIYDGDEDEEDEEEDFEEFGKARSKSRAKAKAPVESSKKKQSNVSVMNKSTNSLLISMNFVDKKKLSTVLSQPSSPGSKETKPKVAAKANSRTRNIKVSYTEPNEDDFGSDIDTAEEVKPSSVKKGNNARGGSKGRGRQVAATADDEDDDEDDDRDEDDDEVDDDEDLDLEENMDDIEESDVDFSKLSERQRSKVLGVSEEPEETTPEFYEGKKLPKSVLALMEGSSKKKALTEEEIQLKKAEAARKRKTFNMRKLEAEKKETLKKLLHRKIDKVDAKKQEEENERRRRNQLKRKELITHKALFSWVSKTETVDDKKTSVSLYSMQ
ncbi:hypothetical protein PMKS-003139 [Pichia membranifaciens]|uniref:INO80 complex subunit B-like conserved region domain-containing protein n=1 Tax=Pichia membranifaciens TaxID=4926 RepID=A0A1Q2YJA7_9ASCO|nr:hypothetical protein PMKS-003139 [Pichia membranifaciens]